MRYASYVGPMIICLRRRNLNCNQSRAPLRAQPPPAALSTDMDGRDKCCECTCQIQGSADDEWGGRWPGCNEFACIDPSAACVDDDPITVDMLETCSDVSHELLDCVFCGVTASSR